MFVDVCIAYGFPCVFCPFVTVVMLLCTSAMADEGYEAFVPTVRAQLEPHKEFPMFNASEDILSVGHFSPLWYPVYKGMHLDTSQGHKQFIIESFESSQDKWKVGIYESLWFWNNKVFQSGGFFEYEIEEKIGPLHEGGRRPKWLHLTLDMLSPTERHYSSHDVNGFKPLLDFHYYVAKKFQKMFPCQRLWAASNQTNEELNGEDWKFFWEFDEDYQEWLANAPPHSC